ncbi:hypothetical protein [Bradyrhizobium sp. 6(2017)]|uniref:hypothetical protein n=1 Tax=Bradyrhizobium sp. 6(2017) TaxID=1197460 RepID=UPI0013E11E36|nr:hypothetical protein [Bradyrhizobium sp. 6(2017)]QIG96812.1 hypothetical protein G6P99_33365 [Bradyrhizobium sp. 6(2017)]
MTKMKEERPWADPEKVGRRIMQRAREFEPLQDGRIYIEKISWPLLYLDKASPAEYWAGVRYAIDKGWLEYHESGTCVKILHAGSDLLA